MSRVRRLLVECPFSGPAVLIGTMAVGLAARYGAHASAAGVIGALAVFWTSLALMHVTAGLFDHTRLTIPSFFYLSYLPMIYFPSFVVFGERTDPARWTFLIGVHLVLLMVPLGIGALNLIARYRASEHSRFYTAPMVVPTTGVWQVPSVTAVAVPQSIAPTAERTSYFAG